MKRTMMRKRILIKPSFNTGTSLSLFSLLVNINIEVYIYYK